MWNWPLYSIWSVFELRLYGSQNLWIVRIILVPKPQFAQNLSYGLLVLMLLSNLGDDAENTTSLIDINDSQLENF